MLTVDVRTDPVEPAHRVLLPRGEFFMGLPLMIRDGTVCPVRAVAFVPEG